LVRGQPELDPSRLVFIDQPWASAPFIIELRNTRLAAPKVFDEASGRTHPEHPALSGRFSSAA
jgi:hypothetical protein